MHDMIENVFGWCGAKPFHDLYDLGV